MNKLQDLIKEKCPNGVDYVEIKSVAEVGTGNSDRKDAVEDGEYPFYVRSKEIFKINKYEYDETAIVIPGEGGIGEIFHFVQGKYALHQRAYRIHLLDDRIDAKFLYYYMFASFKSFIMKKAVSATVTSIRKPMIEEFEVPVPPIEIQHEIVCILDGFTELQAGLQTELENRRRQYNYYRDMLLSKNDKVETVRLDTVCGIYDGTHQTPKYTESGVPFVSVENIDDLNGTTKYISYEAYQKFKIKPQIGDVFMTRITAGVIGKCAVVNSNEDMAYYVSLALLRPDEKKLNSYYLKYYLESSHGKKELAKRILWDATPTKINKDDIGKVLITIPSVDVQEELVQVLDSFESICYDMNVGLPAEIAARHKQYEYYRDKLLTFKRKEV